MKLSDEVLRKIGEDSWAVVESALPGDFAKALKAQAVIAYNSGLFHSAKVGRSQLQVHAPAIRSDSILWLDLGDQIHSDLAQELESLRLVLNQKLFLGLQTFEAHFACYEQGSAYAEHLDQPQLKSPLHGERVMSFVIYLNEHWSSSDGGALCLNLGSEIFSVQPIWNRLVLFRSKEIRHSVQEAKRPRWTLTGWFRRI